PSDERTCAASEDSDSAVTPSGRPMSDCMVTTGSGLAGEGIAHRRRVASPIHTPFGPRRQQAHGLAPDLRALGAGFGNARLRAPLELFVAHLLWQVLRQDPDLRLFLLGKVVAAAGAELLDRVLALLYLGPKEFHLLIPREWRALVDRGVLDG